MNAVPSRVLLRSDSQFRDALYRAIENNYGSPSFTIKALADVLHISERQLQRRVQSIFDKRPAHLIRDYRLAKSKDLLEAGMPVGEVAAAVGFRSHAYFTNCFRNRFGYVPSRRRADECG
jgi:AraC-like DNA-binding protein